MYLLLPLHIPLWKCALRHLLVSTVVCIANIVITTQMNVFWLVFSGMLLEVVSMIAIWKSMTEAKLFRVVRIYLVSAVLGGLGNAAGRGAHAIIMIYMGVPNVLQFGANFVLESLAIALCQWIALLGGATLIRRIFKRTAEDVRATAFVWILFTQVAGMCLIAYFTYWDRPLWIGQIINLCYLLLCCVADWQLLRTFRDLVKSAALEEEVSLLQQQKALQKSAYRSSASGTIMSTRWKRSAPCCKTGSPSGRNRSCMRCTRRRRGASRASTRAIRSWTPSF